MGAGAFVLMVVLGAMSLWKWREASSNAQEARKQTSIAESRLLLAQSSEVQESQPDLSLLLNVEALQIAPAAAKEEARFALMNKLDRPYHVSTPRTGHTDAVWDVAFNSDGELLASASQDRTVRLWNLEVESLVSEACRIANRDLSGDEWNSFVGSEFDYVRTCSSLPAG